ncbi:MAG: hypothetical protein HOV79_11930 [Hamadaea sp.]|nr:hypothetical protein [Hamadaea sp.]
MARHRHDDDDFGADDATEVMPAVGAESHRRGTFTASPLLLAAGGVALALVLVVGSWALVGGGGSSEDPLVYPWSSESPGQIDVSVSLQPTDLPTGEPSPSLTGSPSASPTGSGSPSPSPTPPRNNGLVVTQGQANRNAEGYRVSYIVANKGTTRVTAWRMEITFSENYKLADSWNANTSQPEPRRLVLTSQRALDPGASIDVGIRVESLGSNLGTPVSCTIDGRSFSCVPRWTS